MIICGIKLTHDGAVALIDNGRLVFSYELEKLNNRKRHALLDNFHTVAAILRKNGYLPEQVDRYVLDGWDELGEFEAADAPVPGWTLYAGEQPVRFPLARYGHEVSATEDVLAAQAYFQPALSLHYHSYLHVSGHIFGAYCSSPFAAVGQSAYCLVWDGGMYPQLFYYDGNGGMTNLGAVARLNGNVYSLFAQQFPPFKALARDAYDLSIAGKVMAYTGLGRVDMSLLERFRAAYAVSDQRWSSMELVEVLLAAIAAGPVVRGEDAIATFDKFLELELISGLREQVERHGGVGGRLCYAGGCALNIKWNSAIRGAGLFEAMWVPPFPNDAGSAIGAACCEMMRSGQRSLAWEVYSGPDVREMPITQEGWSQAACDIAALARLLYESEEPVVVINGRAELGPRSLGNRSILADARSRKMKQLLNDIKQREDYRPVAPVCLEERAPALFTPGSPDPLMLYDHQVREEWLDRIPAVCHVDGSARLQTVNAIQHPVLHALLTHYEALSGVPLLCNTSANYKGAGFFPDVDSAIVWGKVNYIWSRDVLYFKTSFSSYPL